jgi:hypothetical protein
MLPRFTVPVYDTTEFHEFIWSEESLILQQSEGQVAYHNFTVYIDGDG